VIPILAAVYSLGEGDQVIRAVGNDYDGIEWVGEPPLTREQVEDEYLRLLDADGIQQITDNRKLAYQNESDPLFFKAQRGEAELSEWEAKIEVIRQRFPYPPSSIFARNLGKLPLRLYERY